MTNATFNNRLEINAIRREVKGFNMKRFLVFGGDIYYPSGGMKDLQKEFDDLSEAMGFALGFAIGSTLAWTQVYDTEEKRIVKEFDWRKLETD